MTGSSDPPRHVFVTGAGFTRAFVRDAPLLIDDFGSDRLVDAVPGLPLASRVLEAERNRRRDGHIDIERLMTRLHALMPYDHDHGSTEEFALLLSKLKQSLLRRIQDAIQDAGPVDEIEEIAAFARHCSGINATCVTFNYDDLLDAALSNTSRWNAGRGYGFFCRPSGSTVQESIDTPAHSDLLLLKLHGSINWRARLGYPKPFALDAIVHHHDWGSPWTRQRPCCLHPPSVITGGKSRRPAFRGPRHLDT